MSVTCHNTTPTIIIRVTFPKQTKEGDNLGKVSEPILRKQRANSEDNISVP